MMRRYAAAELNSDSGSERRIHLIQGEFRVSDLPEVVLITTLGSCIATCMRDPIARIGGMNHFLLPHGDDAAAREALRYGAHAMELLINGLLRAGARRDRLEAKLFGGGRLTESLPDIGRQNIEFAERFLAHEGIAMNSGSVGGRQARRLQFWPESGRVRQLALNARDDTIFETERRKPPVVQDAGSIELFED